MGALMIASTFGARGLADSLVQFSKFKRLGNLSQFDLRPAHNAYAADYVKVLVVGPDWGVEQLCQSNVILVSLSTRSSDLRSRIDQSTAIALARNEGDSGEEVVQQGR
jgi:hypothetical protein